VGIGIDKDRVYRTVDVFKHGKVVVWKIFAWWLLLKAMRMKLASEFKLAFSAR
jgi:hypothetical protein